MEQSSNCPSFDKCLEHSKQFLVYLANGDRIYHNHKETMAYAGTALFVTGFTAALISPNLWPIYKTSCSYFNWILSFLIVIFTWFIYLIFLCFELRNRRLAAIRLSAAEKVLAEWSCKQPAPDELKTESYDMPEKEKCCLSFLWPPPQIYFRDNEIMPYLPSAFIKTLKEKTKEKHSSIWQERLFFLISHVLTALMLIKLSVSAF